MRISHRPQATHDVETLFPTCTTRTIFSPCLAIATERSMGMLFTQHVRHFLSYNFIVAAKGMKTCMCGHACLCTERSRAFRLAESGRAQAVWQSKAGGGWAKWTTDGEREREREDRKWERQRFVDSGMPCTGLCFTTTDCLHGLSRIPRYSRQPTLVFETPSADKNRQQLRGTPGNSVASQPRP